MIKNVSLLPEDIIEEGKEKRKLKFWIAALSVSLLLSLPLLLNLEWSIYKIENEISGTRADEQKVQELIDELNLLQDRKEKLGLKQSILSEIMDDIPWQQTLSKIANSTNPNTWLEELDIITGENTENKPAPADGVIKATGGFFAPSKEGNKEEHYRISISGYSISNIDLAEFMASLTTENKFQSVNLEFAEETNVRGAKAVKFLIKCGI